MRASRRSLTGAYPGASAARSVKLPRAGSVASMREIFLHDTLSGQRLALRPRDPGRVSMYVCGPTVYSRVHIGNARPFVIFSLLARFLAHEGYAVTFVCNVTDVNDKIYAAAAAAGRPSAQLAAEMTRLYRQDTDALGLGRPDHEPLASESIGQIVDYIQALIDGGHAYARDGDVFFGVRTDTSYGVLSHRRLEDMDQGEDVEGAQRKDDPLDFALWKAHKPGEDTAWEAPWGRGRPGWHIECSAMAEGLLGVDFDVHGGGSDLIFPHHENEAAQTRSARGAELARLWVHNGMLQSTGEKMAKSQGNIAPLHELVAVYGRDAVVLYLLGGHYRQPLAFSPGELKRAATVARRIREASRRLAAGPSPPSMAPLREEFFGALADDFNTQRALAAVLRWVRDANTLAPGTGSDDLAEMLGVLGLERLLQPDSAAPTDVQQLAVERQRARGQRDFDAADRLRAELGRRGWAVRDVADGFELVPL